MLESLKFLLIKFFLCGDPAYRKYFRHPVLILRRDKDWDTSQESREKDRKDSKGLEVSHV